jgi:hypothetical protein
MSNWLYNAIGPVTLRTAFFATLPQGCTFSSPEARKGPQVDRARDPGLKGDNGQLISRTAAAAQKPLNENAIEIAVVPRDSASDTPSLNSITSNKMLRTVSDGLKTLSSHEAENVQATLMKVGICRC